MTEITDTVYSVEQFLGFAGSRSSTVCAVLGRPVAHSLSPVIHLGSAAALGLDDLEYVRVDAGEPAEVRRLLRTSPPNVAGFSVTMPGKSAAHDLADEVTGQAALIGTANTLIPLRDDQGVPTGRWLAENTDVDGVSACLDAVGAEGTRAVVVGNGGTSRPAVAALARAGFTTVTVLARSERALNLQTLVESYGMDFDWRRLDDDGIGGVCAASDVLVSTVPASGVTAASGVATALARAPRVVDVIYDPYPTDLLAEAGRSGRPVADGLLMLAGQGVEQFRLFTGESPSVDGMYRLLREHRGLD
ncbi:MAG: shikimate dehydrogenase [Mycobacteriaceae bacterium]|uniref:shikimate dehydrogenase n=1 Tax=Corynebacterium sp. TaxID=1720 RepID=UPI003F9E9C07